MDPASHLTCPLCQGHQTTVFFSDRKRDYLQCQGCLLVFVPSEQHVSETEEKAIYDLHQNAPDDPGYRRFLARLSDPLSKRLAAHATGLDYGCGCGPAPALPGLLAEKGYSVQRYDPFYANDPTLLTQRYAFITCSEVVEHFRCPGREFARLFAMLQPRGHLGIMTKRVLDAEAFSRWHYKNDPTHISFFSIDTFQWLADKYRCRVEFAQQDVAIFQVV